MSSSHEAAQHEFHFRNFSVVAEAVEDLFRFHGVRPNPTSFLAKSLRAARQLASIADRPETVQVDRNVFYDALCCARLAKAILFMGYDSKYRRHFHDLYDGDLNFWVPARSKAKDVEWEVSLWAHLNQCIPGCAELLEPDIVLALPSKKFGIACKRVYSFKNTVDQVGSAVNQLRRHNLLGIVALSFNSFPPDKDHYHVPRARSIDDLKTGATPYVDEIWRRIFPQIVPKYLQPNRLLGLIISFRDFVQVGDAPHSIYDFFFTRFQTYEGSPPVAKELMDVLYAAGFSDGGMSDAVLLTKLAELKARRPQDPAA